MLFCSVWTTSVASGLTFTDNAGNPWAVDVVCTDYYGYKLFTASTTVVSTPGYITISSFSNYAYVVGAAAYITYSGKIGRDSAAANSATNLFPVNLTETVCTSGIPSSQRDLLVSTTVSYYLNYYGYNYHIYTPQSNTNWNTGGYGVCGNTYNQNGAAGGGVPIVTILIDYNTLSSNVANTYTANCYIAAGYPSTFTQWDTTIDAYTLRSSNRFGGFIG